MTVHVKVSSSDADAAVERFREALDRFSPGTDVHLRMDVLVDDAEWTAAARTEPPAPTLDGQWEYQLLAIRGDLVTGLNGIGEQRWAVCALMGEDADGVIVMVKRPKSLIEVVKGGIS